MRFSSEKMFSFVLTNVVFFTLICQCSSWNLAQVPTLKYLSLQVMNCACFVMYLLLVVLFVMYLEGVFLRPGEQKRKNPLLVCLPEHRAACPLWPFLQPHLLLRTWVHFCLESFFWASLMAVGPISLRVVLEEQGRKWALKHLCSWEH